MRVRVCNQAKARYKYSWRRNYICAPSCAPDQIINQKNTTVQDKEKTRADEILVPKANKSRTTCMHHYSCSLTTLFSPTRVCALNSTLLFLSYTLDQPRIYLPTSQDLFAILSFSSRSWSMPCFSLHPLHDLRLYVPTQVQCHKLISCTVSEKLDSFVFKELYYLSMAIRCGKMPWTNVFAIHNFDWGTLLEK